MAHAANRTSVDTIRLEIARRIVAGALAPGDTLEEGRLATEFGVSRTPVREALRQLVSSGLVDRQPHRKAVVTKPDEDMLHGMFAVMGYLEALCARLAALAMSAAERRALEDLHGDMEVMVRQGDTAAYTAANETFHGAIYDGTRNAYLAGITRTTRSRVQPFRRAQFQTLGRLSASHAEHSAIVSAILRGDAGGAERAMMAHIGFVEHAWQRFAGHVQAGPGSAMKALHDP